MHEAIQYLMLAAIGYTLHRHIRWAEERVFEQHQKIKKLQRSLTATQLRVFNEQDKEEKHIV